MQLSGDMFGPSIDVYIVLVRMSGRPAPNLSP